MLLRRKALLEVKENEKALVTRNDNKGTALKKTDGNWRLHLK